MALTVSDAALRLAVASPSLCSHMICKCKHGNRELCVLGEILSLGLTLSRPSDLFHPTLRYSKLHLAGFRGAAQIFFPRYDWLNFCEGRLHGLIPEEETLIDLPHVQTCRRWLSVDVLRKRNMSSPPALVRLHDTIHIDSHTTSPQMDRLCCRFA